MDKFQICINERTNTSFLKPHDDIYRYNQEGRIPWLQRLCFWILKKLKAYYIENVSQTSIITIDKNKTLEEIIRKVSVDFFYDSNCKYILVGRDVLSDLRKLNQELSFYIPQAFYESYGSGCSTRGEYMGLTIIYIPWMMGALPLPEKLGEKILNYSK
jgi:hypothetical protein